MSSVEPSMLPMAGSMRAWRTYGVGDMRPELTRRGVAGRLVIGRLGTRLKPGILAVLLHEERCRGQNVCFLSHHDPLTMANSGHDKTVTGFACALSWVLLTPIDPRCTYGS